MLHTNILIAAFFPLVSASIYPTQPIQATVWSADQPMLVTWVEDWKSPTLDDMGLCSILLYRDTDTFLIQLASGVDPMAKSYQVTVPNRVLSDGSKYTLRFLTDTPKDTAIYSADFSMVPANTTTNVTGSATVMESTESGATGTAADFATGSGFGSTSTTSAFTTRTSSTDAATALSSNASSAPSGIPSPSSAIPGGEVPGQRKSAGRRSIDMEKIKFRFVFVIWPVLMGITMAL